MEAAKEAEEVTKRYGVSVVGLTHSRGVAGVMPGGATSSLEGVSGLTQRGKFYTCNTLILAKHG